LHGPVLAKRLPPGRLIYSFEIMEESGAQSTGGDFESVPGACQASFPTVQRARRKSKPRPSRALSSLRLCVQPATARLPTGTFRFSGCESIFGRFQTMRYAIVSGQTQMTNHFPGRK